MDNTFDQQSILSQNLTDPIEIRDIELGKFKALFRLLTIIISKKGQSVMFESEFYQTTFSKYGNDVVAKVIDNQYHHTKNHEFDFSLVYEGIRTDYSIVIKDVLYHDHEAYLGIIQEQSRYSAAPSTDEKISRISSALLKIVSSVDIGDDISKTLDMILAESIKAFDYGHFGTVFIVQDDYFKNISNIGYSDDIKDFKLTILETFLYIATQGKMDRVTIVNDIQGKYTIKPVKTNTGEFTPMGSALVAPIFYKGSLYGMMSIDSTQNHVFTQDDLAIMTFIRDNVQVAISNQLTFLERTNQALTDNMTGLYNRHFLVEHFNTLLERAKRYQESFSVVVFDLDDLKVINDRYGHLVGDLLIKSFAKTLTSETRRSDVLARFGGDEFVAIILTDKVDEIEKKIHGFDKRFVYQIEGKDPLELSYNFSYGISVYPKDGSNYTQLINVADARMYEVKIQNKANKKKE